MNNCCYPCPTTQTVNIPGPEGEAGASGENGTNGVNAFTLVTEEFTVPAIGANVTATLANTQWMAEGQKVIIEGPATFEVVSVVTETSVILKFLGYTGDVDPSDTITTGSKVSPSGAEPDVTLLPGISSYATGGSGSLSTSSAQVLGLTVTLTETRTYLLFATLRLDLDVATFNSSATITAKLRRTNNTAADVPNATVGFATGVTSAESGSLGGVQIPFVLYEATAGDIIQLYANLGASPYSGAVKAVEGSILAIPLF